MHQNSIKHFSNNGYVWCHPERVSGSTRRDSSSTADTDSHQDDTVDDDVLCIYRDVIYVLISAMNSTENKIYIEA